MSGNRLGFDPYEMLTSDRIGPWGLGWSLNIMGFNGWQHDGRMPGSAAMLVRLDNGLEMAVTEYSERDFFHELGYVLHHIGNNYDWWNDDRDLFQHLCDKTC
ncbi:hypothetical protein ANCCEY_00771 [Ancylostoma ceylanicum]|uniref:Uncharacterized protein n=1 Tax=Ancylostoma ceylanicum TaxID=53326 RepID=A0A0D6M9C2_9BILA|nr:hypothetical protein ANCCEY_00771 [Ancylostoma ceylanicum]